MNRVWFFEPPKLSEVGYLWTRGLRRIARSGGDWRSWYARIPAGYREDGVVRTSLNSFFGRMERQESVLRELQ